MAIKPGEVRVRKLGKPQRGYRWLATFRQEERRARKYFETKAEAQEFADDWQERCQTEGVNHLTDQERGAVLDTRERVSESGFTLRQIIELGLQQSRRLKREGDVDTLLEKRLSKLRAEGKSTTHLYTTKWRLLRFARDFGARGVATILPEEIADWLSDRSEETSARNVINFRTVLSAFFNDGIALGFCDSNPVALCRFKPKSSEQEIGILTVEQARKLLEASDSRSLPFHAIGLFAGLRVSEIVRLDWGDVDLKARTVRRPDGREQTVHGYLRIRAANGKTGKRLVPVEKNLRAWLFPLRQDSGPICPGPGILRTLRDEAQLAAVIDPWPFNALRHSFGSYHLALHQDIARLAEIMGNSPTIIRRHYAELAYPADAAAYFAVFPDAILKQQ